MNYLTSYAKGFLLLTPPGILAILAAGILLILVAFYFSRSWLVRAASLLFLPVVLFWDVPPGWIYFHYLCNHESGEHVEGQIPPTDTIYSDADSQISKGCVLDCRSLLETDKFRFVEADVTKPSVDGLTTAQGTYRFWLEPEDSPKCDLYKQSRAKFIPQARKEREMPDGFCIASEPISEASSQYAYSPRVYYPLSRRLGVWIWEARITDRRTQNIVASVKEIEFRRGWFIYDVWEGDPRSPLLCPERDTFFSMLNSFVHDVLNPERRS
jgi:hypothetical protein